ncbi:MAG: hypothetical protein R3237_03340 [Nitrosopumilaceae archaeon]|nr:hypothetical protein [Nitrosopumilaceae archaeon]
MGTFTQTSFADSVSVDKEKYQFGETINVSGRVSYVEDSFVGLQILNPSKSDIVVIDQFFPQKDGKFSKNYKAQGPKWNEEGFYHLKLVYNHEVFEKQFFFEKPMNANPDKGISSEPKEESIPAKSETQNDGDEKTSKHDLKLIVKNFPDPSKPPSHYLDRYYSERAYQDWFDSVFKENSIIEVVGFGSTHVQGFPDNTKSAWHYVNRYHNEESYRDWFDSEFPSKSIFEVLGYPESLFQRVPDWIKNNAKWWSEGLITDRDFLKGIEYLIIEKIIFIPDLPEPGNSSTKTIPEWIKNTAKWWSEGKIDENEFLNGITFLIENKIITV